MTRIRDSASTKRKVWLKSRSCIFFPSRGGCSSKCLTCRVFFVVCICFPIVSCDFCRWTYFFLGGCL